MHFKSPEIEIVPQEPFSNDQLDRSESAHILTQFVSSLNGPFVLCINSNWGTGKTTFVKMWQQYLKNHDYHCLYFNAWEHDFSITDPLIPFIAEMQSEITSTLNENQTQIRDKLEKAKEIGGSIARRAIPVAIKALTSGCSAPQKLDHVLSENQVQ